MAGRLAEEIHQSKPFASLAEEALLNLSRTAEVVQLRLAEFLKQFGLSPTQYNLLRILRGAGPAGTTCSQASERMVNHDPDITRLMDRLEARGLMVRERSRQDRRVVISRITEEGLRLVDSVDAPLQEFVAANYGHVDEAQLRVLIELLEQLRNAPEVS
jgi:DNA-binding MarR family transcriptional regulator